MSRCWALLPTEPGRQLIRPCFSHIRAARYFNICIHLGCLQLRFQIFCAPAHTLFTLMESQSGDEPTSTGSNTSLGSFVASFGRSARCWEAIGGPRELFRQRMTGDIVEALQNDPDPVRDHLFTVSLYMIGRSKTTATPTILFISKNPQSRKHAKRVMKESGVLLKYPNFSTKYVDKDPGSVNIVSLAVGGVPMASNIAAEILYDPSEPMRSMGLAIYVSHADHLRPATANVLRLGNQTFLQTVRHAFHENLPESNSTISTAEDDLVIDSDSDSESEQDDELHIDITSAGSRSPNTVSYATSLKSGYSRSYSFVSGTSIHAANDDSDEINTMVSSLPSSIESAMDELTPFALKFPKFRPQQPVQPCRESLRTLGRLVDESLDNDWALIEITNAQAIESMNALIAYEETLVHAYDKIAWYSTENTKIFTCTASGGRLSGVLSGTTSYSRLPNGSAFRKVYLARMDGPLANGDCGSAIMDVHTKKTYGHLIAGCRTSGTAYVLAAHQITGDLERISRLLCLEQGWTRQWASTCEPQPQETDFSGLIPRSSLVNAIGAVHGRKHTTTTTHRQSSIPIESSQHHTRHNLRPSLQTSRKIRKLPRKQTIGPQTKRWRAVFFTKRLFCDKLFFTARECIIGFEREDGPLDSFLEDAESSIPAWEMTVIIEFLRTNKPYSTSARHLARARLDDREHGSGQCRDHPEWLTSNQLQDALLKQVI